MPQADGGGLDPGEQRDDEQIVGHARQRVSVPNLRHSENRAARKAKTKITKAASWIRPCKLRGPTLRMGSVSKPMSAIAVPATKSMAGPSGEPCPLVAPRCSPSAKKASRRPETTKLATCAEP